MDSIDVYLEKKRKRMEGFNQSVKRAKVREQDNLKAKTSCNHGSRMHVNFVIIKSASEIMNSVLTTT